MAYFPPSRFDAAGLAATETTRATAAEALLVPLSPAVNTANSSTAITLTAPATNPIQDITLNGAAPAITLPTSLAGQSFVLILRQDATGGRVPTWVGTVKWPGGAAPTLTATASAVDAVSFQCIIAGTWFGFPAGYDVK